MVQPRNIETEKTRKKDHQPRGGNQSATADSRALSVPVPLACHKPPGKLAILPPTRQEVAAGRNKTGRFPHEAVHCITPLQPPWHGAACKLVHNCTISSSAAQNVAPMQNSCIQLLPPTFSPVPKKPVVPSSIRACPGIQAQRAQLNIHLYAACTH